MTKTKPKSVREIATAKLAENAEKERLQREADAKHAAEQRETTARGQVHGFLERSLSTLQEAFKVAADPQNAKFNSTPFFKFEVEKTYNSGFSKYITADTLQQDPLFKKFNQTCKKADVQLLWDTGTRSVDSEPYDSMPRTDHYDYIKFYVNMSKPYKGAQRADMKKD